MSTEANAALAWPVEITEFAYLGDQLADELRSGDDERHYGSYVWPLAQDERPMFSLLGTTWPGELYAYSPWAEGRVSAQVDREFRRLYADAGFYDPLPRSLEDGYPPVPRPCVGDPRMDPRVLEEGCVVPWLQPAQMWDTLDDPVLACSEPEDYDGYIDWLREGGPE